MRQRQQQQHENPLSPPTVHRENSLQSLVRSASQLSLSRFKNERAPPGTAYVPTCEEHVANILSHSVMIPASLYKLHSMVSRSGDPLQLTSSLVYGLATILLFVVSSTFHVLSYWGKSRFWKEVFHRGDRVFIYVFIAASYTPWLTLREFDHDYGRKCLLLIWPAAAAGIAYQLIFHEKYKWLEVVMYVAVGMLPAFVTVKMKNPLGLWQMAAGGAAYGVGVVFFKLDGVVPFAHAIWHLFVVVGAVLQYNAVSAHLIDH